MSYCRWSSDDFECDIYCYHDCGGYWRTIVASKRVVPSEPMPALLDTRDPDWTNYWFERSQEVGRIVKASGHKPIGLPHDGKDFRDSTPGECADRLEMLRNAGYNVPQYAIDALREEEVEAP